MEDTSPPESGLQRWILGVLAALVLAGGMALLTNLWASVNSVHDDIGKHGERISIVEEKARRVVDDIAEMNRDLRELLRRTPER